nr:unnamed protein product [Digitaria exilis]
MAIVALLASTLTATAPSPDATLHSAPCGPAPALPPPPPTMHSSAQDGRRLSTPSCRSRRRAGRAHAGTTLAVVTVEEKAYHKSCFKCSHGGCAITPSNYAALEGILYCKHHFSQLFKEKGSYNHLIKCASVKRAAEAQPAADSS